MGNRISLTLFHFLVKYVSTKHTNMTSIETACFGTSDGVQVGWGASRVGYKWDEVECIWKLNEYSYKCLWQTDRDFGITRKRDKIKREEHVYPDGIYTFPVSNRLCNPAVIWIDATEYAWQTKQKQKRQYAGTSIQGRYSHHHVYAVLCYIIVLIEKQIGEIYKW